MSGWQRKTDDSPSSNLPLFWQSGIFHILIFSPILIKIENETMNCIQIIDGVLLGTWDSVYDQFLVMKNQIGLIIHSPTLQVPSNLPNLRFIEFEWFVGQELFSSVLLRRGVQAILQQIDHIGSNYGNVLVCSHGVTSQSIGICCLILMTKFRWSLLKTLQYLSKKIHFLDFPPHHTHCLLQYDKYINKNSIKEKLCTWEKEDEISEEAVLARNTYLNSDMQKSLTLVSENPSIGKNKKVRKRVSFKEDNQFRFIEKEPTSDMPTIFATKTNHSTPKYDPDFVPERARLKIEVSLLQKRRRLNEISAKSEKNRGKTSSNRLNSYPGSQKWLHTPYIRKITTNREIPSKIQSRQSDLLVKIKQKISAKFVGNLLPHRQLKFRNGLQVDRKNNLQRVKV